MVQIWFLNLHKNGPIRDQGKHLLYISRPPLCLRGTHFRFSLEVVFPQQTVYLNKVTPFTAPQIGDTCWQWIGGSDLLLTIHIVSLHDTFTHSTRCADVVDPEKEDTYQEEALVAN